MTEAMTFKLVHATARSSAVDAIMRAPIGYVAVVRPPNRSHDQNAMLHALLTAIAKNGTEWAGRTWDVDAWKAIMVSAHSQATRGESLEPPLIRGIEGELVPIRESTAGMSVARLNSLISYIEAWCAGHGIQLKDGQ